MNINDRMHDAIVQRAGAHEFHRIALENGLVSMWDYGLQLTLSGATTLQELLRVTRMGH
jgi:type II secretory ATPase GspE/PulE/Tfp pilus assembly ATPase PilB-like protein